MPTPRGGGGAIVIAFLAGLLLLFWFNGLDIALVGAMGGAGLLVAMIGFLDDHGHVAARWRLLGHFAAAVIVLGTLGALPPLPIAGHDIHFGAVGYVLGALFLVWMLNLYNFMDGIDGIASVQAISVCVGAAVLYLLTQRAELAWLPSLLACCVAGFLIWNFPPAKIFMGDAGSGFLGISLATLALAAGKIDGLYFWAWLVLMGVFIVDATFTLFRRLLRGEKVYEAHRSHGYQFAARRHGGHLPVTVMVGLINVVWLLPVSVCMVKSWVAPLPGIVLGYLPLVILAIRYHAGAMESEQVIDKGV